MIQVIIRHNWSYEEALMLYQQPFMDLIWQAQQVHRACFKPNTIQVCDLQNIKIGGCPEDCGWCGQSVYHGVESKPLASMQSIIDAAKAAKARGAMRVCLAASWRKPTNRNLQEVKEMVKGIKSLGLETCITIGQLTADQAQELKAMGLDYYNHNIETSEKHFKNVSTTRTFQDRLNTLHNVQSAGLKVCSGGIFGMGETTQDRLEMLITLANLSPHPKSVPLNQLVRIPGTPLENAEPVKDIDYVRCVAVARIMMPNAYIRLSGGRVLMSPTMQTLCFVAGANSIHHGIKLLVTPNVDMMDDKVLLQELGLQVLPPEPTDPSSPQTIPCVTLVPA